MKEIAQRELNENVFNIIGKEWMLVTAQSEGRVNTMTASWGGLGIMWGKPVAFVFIRPERYTHEFIEREARFTLSFLGEGLHREAYRLLGTKSGRDCDKIAESGLHLTETPEGQPTFSEARLTMVCRKLFKSPLRPEEFIDKKCLSDWYNDKPGGSLHDLYIVEIEHIYEIRD